AIAMARDPDLPHVAAGVTEQGDPRGAPDAQLDRVRRAVRIRSAHAPTAKDGGWRRWKSVASWYAFATRSVSPSPYRRPTNESETGVFSSVNPFGSTTVGCPVRFVRSRMLPPYDGVTTTSTACIASCMACMTSVRTRFAL